MDKITASLTPREWDIIGLALLELPGKVCNPLIANLNAQFAQQGKDHASTSDGRGQDQPAAEHPIRPSGDSEGNAGEPARANGISPH